MDYEVMSKWCENVSRLNLHLKKTVLNFVFSMKDIRMFVVQHMSDHLMQWKPEATTSKVSFWFRLVVFSPIIISKWEIDSRVRRNQTTIMWICERWMQEDTIDQCGQSHPPQCTISREDRQIMRMAVTDRSVTS
ncbi:transposable element Tcb1 transposase [Trichonephila clavipes]|nr:transposable element Tcb1 transposase [Trichonephila clavipes]